MAPFGKWPPFGRKKTDQVEEQAYQVQERPEALDVDALIEKVNYPNGDLAGLMEALDSNYDSWSKFSQDRNYFSGGEGSPKRELWKARIEIVKAAQRMLKSNEYTRQADADVLRSKLEEYAGPMTFNLETAVEETQKNFIASRQATPAEQRKTIVESVGEIEKLSNKGGESVVEETAHEPVQNQTGSPAEPAENVVPFPGKRGTKNPVETASTPEDREMERRSAREEKASRFAEKYGITAERTAMLEAEQEYANAIRDRKSKFFTLKFRDQAATREQQDNLEDKISAWRDALAKAGEQAEKSGEKQDSISARFISARDTMTRMERTRQEAVAEGLDKQSKTTLGGIDKWANKFNKGALKVAGKGLDLFNKASEKTGGLLVGRFVDKEKDIEKYKKASRIVGGALLTSAIFAPAGAVAAGAAGTALMWRIARGFALGFGGSAYITKQAGKGYEKKFGAKEERLNEHLGSREELHAVLRGKSGSFEKMSAERLREAFQKADKKKFAESEAEHDLWKKRTEAATTILVGGMASFGAAHWPAVHDSLSVGAPHPAGGAHLETQPGTAGNLPPHTPEPRVHVESVSVHENVNDADKLLGRFVDNVRHQFPNPQDAPPALRTLLEHSHSVDGMHQQDVLTRFLHLQENDTSVVVHPGDTVSFENGKVMFQGHELIDEHGTPHNLQTSHEIHMGHPHQTTHAERPHMQHAAHPSEAVPQPRVEQVPEPTDQPTPTSNPVSQPTPAVTPATAPATEVAPQTGPRIVPQEIQTEAAPQPEVTPEPTHAVAPEDTAAPRIVPAKEAPEAPRVAPVENAADVAQQVQPAPVHLPEVANDNVPTEAPLAATPLENHSVETPTPPVDVPVPHEAVPSHESVPTNDNELHTESESAPASAPSAAEHLVTNHYGIQIDPTTPHIYSPAGTNGQVFILYGGTPETSQRFIEEYFRNPDLLRHPLLTPAINPADPSGRQVLIAYEMNAAGNQIIPTPALNPQGRQIFFQGIEEFDTIIQ